MTGLSRLLRRLRYGAPIVVVSGLPRSGTSMMMQMLAAGGVALVADDARAADESNPAGYFELEAVKRLESNRDPAWLGPARGRAVKVLTSLLPHLPETSNYKVILMRRDLTEVIASQNAMLARRGEPAGALSADDLRTAYETHLRKIDALLRRRPCFETIEIDYGEALANPRATAGRVSRFLGRPLALDRMAASVDARLYRNRRRANDR